MKRKSEINTFKPTKQPVYQHKAAQKVNFPHNTNILTVLKNPRTLDLYQIITHKKQKNKKQKISVQKKAYFLNSPRKDKHATNWGER